MRPSLLSRTGIMKKLLKSCAFASVFVLAACTAQTTDAPEETTKDEDMKPKNAVVATVNGEAITQAQLDERVALVTQGQGQAPDTAIILNQLIDEELVFQDAAAKNIEVSEEELDTQYNIVIQNSGGAEALKGQLSQLNLSPSALRKDLAVQLLIQKYLESEVNVDSVTVTNAEIQTAYDEIAAAQQNVPPLDDNVREQIRTQLNLQKRNELALEHVKNLRESADVEILSEEKEEMMMEEEEMEDNIEDETVVEEE